MCTKMLNAEKIFLQIYSIFYLANFRPLYEGDGEIRRLLPENAYVTIYRLKSYMFLKVGIFFHGA